MNFIAIVRGIECAKLVILRQMINLAASGVGVVQRIGMGNARPGFVILIFGPGRGSRFRRQFWPLEFHIVHGDSIRHMSPHMRFWRVGAGGYGEFHAAVDGGGDQRVERQYGQRRQQADALRLFNHQRGVPLGIGDALIRHRRLGGAKRGSPHDQRSVAGIGKTGRRVVAIFAMRHGHGKRGVRHSQSVQRVDGVHVHRYLFAHFGDRIA